MCDLVLGEGEVYSLVRYGKSVELSENQPQAEWSALELVEPTSQLFWLIECVVPFQGECQNLVGELQKIYHGQM